MPRRLFRCDPQKAITLPAERIALQADIKFTGNRLWLEKREANRKGAKQKVSKTIVSCLEFGSAFIVSIVSEWLQVVAIEPN
eukprot:1628619-Amphidinium_carterae.1